MKMPTFLIAENRLRGDDAVAAVLVLEDGRYVMQLRDDIPNIFYPDHWGCFGGAVNADEEPLQALHRELEEELELKISGAIFFSRFDFEIKAWPKKVFRNYYEVPVTLSEYSRLVLHEGAEVKAFTGAEILQQRVTPYDAFAIWLHFKRSRFA